MKNLNLIIYKTFKYSIKLLYFFLLSFFKRKPDFLIIGAMKSGTTYLFNLLDQHPQIVLPKIKELHFFDNNYFMGKNWYKCQFPNKSFNKIITGEASPYYIYHPLAPIRSYKFNKKFKIILLLRNPTERAISHYNMFSKMLNIEWEPHNILKIEEELLIQNYMELKLKNHIDVNNPIHRNFSFVRRGIYLFQIKQWQEFYSNTNLLIIKSEDFYKNTNQILDQICDFLNIDRFKGFKLTVDKYQGNYKNKIDEKIISELKKFYKPHNEELESFLNRKFNWE